MHTQVCQISWSWSVSEFSDMGSGNCILVLCKSSKHSELQSRLSSLSLRDLEMRSCWVRVVLKSSRTCSNKGRDGEKGSPQERRLHKVWGQGRSAGDRTQGTGDSVRCSRCWDRQEQVFLELPRGRCYHNTLMQDFCSMLFRGQICVSPLGSTSSPPSQHGPPAPFHSLWPSLL